MTRVERSVFEYSAPQLQSSTRNSLDSLCSHGVSSVQSSELVSQRMRLQAAADAAEVIFHHVGFASGALGCYGRVSATSSSGDDRVPFEQPDPEPIIARYSALEGDVCSVSDTVKHRSRLSNIHATLLPLSVRSMQRYWICHSA